MKRRSATKSRQRPEDVVFFVDRSLGRHTVVDALRGAGAQVEAHDDHFDQNTPDEVWIEVASRGWVILTKDARIRKRPLELAAVTAARAKVFVLTAQNMAGSQMALLLVGHLKRIQSLAVSRRPPFWSTVTKSGVKVQPL